MFARLVQSSAESRSCGRNLFHPSGVALLSEVVEAPRFTPGISAVHFQAGTAMGVAGSRSRKRQWRSCAHARGGRRLGTASRSGPGSRAGARPTSDPRGQPAALRPRDRRSARHMDPRALAEPGQPADRPAGARRPARPRGDRGRPPLRRAARPGRSPARVGRPRRRDPAAAHGRVDRADALAARDHRPGAGRAGRAVARDLRRARGARRAPRGAARGHAGDRAPHARRRPAAGAAVVPGRALGPRGARRRARQPPPPPPHPRRHGRRPPPVGHDGAGPADRARGDRAPPRRRLAAAGRPAGAALRRPRRRPAGPDPLRRAARSARD